MTFLKNKCGSDPRMTYVELTKTAYLFFRIACHSLWPISHLHTIPLERCVFLYAFVSGASFGVVHPPPSSTGVDMAKVSSVAAADGDVPPPTTSDDSDIRHTLDHVLTVQGAYGQILVDVLDEIRALCVELA